MPYPKNPACVNRIVWPWKLLTALALALALLCLVAAWACSTPAWRALAVGAALTAQGWVLGVLLQRWRARCKPAVVELLERCRALVEQQSRGNPADIILASNFSGPYYDALHHRIGIPPALRFLSERALRAVVRHEVEHSHQLAGLDGVAGFRKRLISPPKKVGALASVAVGALLLLASSPLLVALLVLALTVLTYGAWRALNPASGQTVVDEALQMEGEADVAALQEVQMPWTWHRQWVLEVCQALDRHANRRELRALVCAPEMRSRRRHVQGRLG